MNGSSTNSLIVDFMGPEHEVFGINTALPSVVKLFNFHGPSTTDQIGLVAYVARSVACALRNLQTASAPTVVVSGRFAVAAVGTGLVSDVRSQAIGMGTTWLNSL